MSHSRSLCWFRQDLRLSDNPALTEAAKAGDVLPVYILDDKNAGEYAMGGASRFWLHHALRDLYDSLDGRLLVVKGDAKKIIPELVKEHDIDAVFWNRCYEPWRQERDREIKAMLKDELEVEVHSYQGSLLWEPWVPLKDDGTHYKVFTPFYRKGCLKSDSPRHPLPKPEGMRFVHADQKKGDIDDLCLLPERDWDDMLEPHWEIGEQGAQKRMHDFMDDGLQGYKEGRNLPQSNNVSRLSAYLHWGHVSPNQVWYAAEAAGVGGKDLDHFHSELGWREFSYSLLYHYPDLPKTNLQSKFDNFPWKSSKSNVKAWQKGQTGYPIVDAGMRELWQTGYMHNRLRMIVGSFLVKNLMLHWHEGEAWFWDCLVDADLASNSASWQWIAGCGADAAPYFRIFNPITQGEKFDPEGEYTRKYVPELKDLPKKYLYKPWEAPEDVLEKAGVKLGETYPEPIVKLSDSRDQALEAFQSLKKEKDAA